RGKQRGFVLGQVAGGPSDAVLGVELGRQCPPGESDVQPVLGEPCRIFTVAVEAEAEPRVADDVVHGPKPVVGAADRCVVARGGGAAGGCARRRSGRATARARGSPAPARPAPAPSHTVPDAGCRSPGWVPATGRRSVERTSDPPGPRGRRTQNARARSMRGAV